MKRKSWRCPQCGHGFASKRFRVESPDGMSHHNCQHVLGVEPKSEFKIGKQIRDDISDPEKEAMESETAESLLSAIGKLDERYARIITMRFGLGGNVPCTYEEIAQYIGVTRERVRQVEQKGLRRLGRLLEKKLRSDFS